MNCELWIEVMSRSRESWFVSWSRESWVELESESQSVKFFGDSTTFVIERSELFICKMKFKKIFFQNLLQNLNCSWATPAHLSTASIFVAVEFRQRNLSHTPHNYDHNTSKCIITTVRGLFLCRGLRPRYVRVFIIWLLALFGFSIRSMKCYKREYDAETQIYNAHNALFVFLAD